MENKGEIKSIPYIVFEGAQARNERAVKRLVIALIVTILLMFASNGIWLYCWMQFDYVTEDSSITLDALQGDANFIGERGNINYGTDYSETPNNNGN